VKPTTHATFGTYFSVVQEMLMYGNMGAGRKGRLTFKEEGKRFVIFIE
jgi:hypothetical protein